MLAAGGLVVETPSPDALCPPLETTRESVRARLGELELEGTWRASYVLVHRAQGDFVALTLRDPESVVRLERDLPVEGGSCATLSQVIALVLERFFVRPESEPVSRSETAEPEPSPTPAPSEPAPTPVAAPESKTPTIQSESSRTNIDLDAALWVTTAWLAPTAALGVARSHTEFRLKLGFDLREHESAINRGWLALRRAPIALGISRGLVASDVKLALGLDLLGVYEHAQTSGLASSGSSARFIPGLGAHVTCTFFSTGTRPRPFLELGGSWLLGSLARKFMVGPSEVAEPANAVFGVAFGIRTPL
ncbi:MAG: hypothetical protein QM756_15525 [Polyangiaceae bacterium]